MNLVKFLLQAEVGQRIYDWQIDRLLSGKESNFFFCRIEQEEVEWADRTTTSCKGIPPYTSDFEAAKSLIPKDRYLLLNQRTDGTWYCSLYGVGTPGMNTVNAKTPILAIVCSAINARLYPEGE